MGDLASEREAAIELIIEGYFKLKKYNPDHDLLKYITKMSKSSFEFSEDEKLRESFLDKYAPNDKISVAVMLARYFVDLKKEIERIEGKDVERV